MFIGLAGNWDSVDFVAIFVTAEIRYHLNSAWYWKSLIYHLYKNGNNSLKMFHELIHYCSSSTVVLLRSEKRRKYWYFMKFYSSPEENLSVLQSRLR